MAVGALIEVHADGCKGGVAHLVHGKGDGEGKALGVGANWKGHTGGGSAAPTTQIGQAPRASPRNGREAVHR